LRVAADPVAVDCDGNSGLARLGFESRGQTLVGEQWRIDTARQVAERFQRLVGIGLQLDQRRLCLHRVAVEEHLSQTELHLERDQVLLRAVVEVAFEAAALLVLSADQPLPGGAQLVETHLQIGGEADVLEDEAGLMGEIIEELLLHRGELLTGALDDAERPQKLRLLTDGDHASDSCRNGERLVAQCNGIQWESVARP